MNDKIIQIIWVQITMNAKIYLFIEKMDRVLYLFLELSFMLTKKKTNKWCRRVSLTRRMHQPVGMNPRILAKTSEIVRLQTTNNTAITETKPRNRRPLRMRNISCRSVPNFCRPIETICMEETTNNR